MKSTALCMVAFLLAISATHLCAADAQRPSAPAGSKTCLYTVAQDSYTVHVDATSACPKDAPLDRARKVTQRPAAHQMNRQPAQIGTLVGEHTGPQNIRSCLYNVSGKIQSFTVGPRQSCPGSRVFP